MNMDVRLFWMETLLSCLLFLGCYGDRPRLETPQVKKSCAKFIESNGFAVDYRSYEEHFDICFNSGDLAWENKKDIFYVVFYDSVEYIMSLPLGSSEAEIYMLYSIDGGCLDANGPLFERCMEGNIKEKMSVVYDLCRKKVSAPQSLMKKIESFLMEERPSIISVGCDCPRNLDMFIYDGQKYHYFDMIKPSCIDGDLKKDPRIPEYIEFYNEMAAFIKQDFSACRWDNFGNRDKMIRECGKFNWRWKEKYPDLVE